MDAPANQLCMWPVKWLLKTAMYALKHRSRCYLSNYPPQKITLSPVSGKSAVHKGKEHNKNLLSSKKDSANRLTADVNKADIWKCWTDIVPEC